jgi:7-cyano-7-deazaguanine synthase
MSKNKCIVLLSGGQDSTTCLFWAKQKFEEVHAVTINYGQKHSREIESAKKVAELAEVASHEFIDVGNILKSTSPLVNDKYEVAQYEGVGSLPGGVEPTFVPLRNLLFLTLVGNRAVALGVKNIIIGVSEEDFGGYFDCRKAFIDGIEEVINLAAFGEEAEENCISILAPLIFLNKAQTVEVAVEIRGCWEALSYSHTCYKGEYPPCGKCHACILRENGFKEAGLVDPLLSRHIVDYG